MIFCRQQFIPNLKFLAPLLHLLLLDDLLQLLIDGLLLCLNLGTGLSTIKLSNTSLICLSLQVLGVIHLQSTMISFQYIVRGTCSG